MEHAKTRQQPVMPGVVEFLIDWGVCVDLLLENLARIWCGDTALKNQFV